MDTLTEPESKEKTKKADGKMPVFHLLGQDELAVDIIEFRLGRAVQRGVNPEKIKAARQRLAEIREWQPKKLPD